MPARGRKTAYDGAEADTTEPSSSSSASTSTLKELLATASADAEREEVKANNASATEMKHACDDALKRVSPLRI